MLLVLFSLAIARGLGLYSIITLFFRQRMIHLHMWTYKVFTSSSEYYLFCINHFTFVTLFHYEVPWLIMKLGTDKQVANWSSILEGDLWNMISTSKWPWCFRFSWYSLPLNIICKKTSSGNTKKNNLLWELLLYDLYKLSLK